MASEAPVFVDIDVSKAWVDVAVRPTGEAWRVNQDQEGGRGAGAPAPSHEPPVHRHGSHRGL